MDMGDKTTITVSETTLERFNDAKEKTGTGQVELSADAFLGMLLDSWEGDEVQLFAAGNADPVDTITGTDTGPELDFDTGDLAHDISKQLDYNALAAKTAEELEGRLR